MNRPLTILQKIRQNHAIEHAAMHIIARRVPELFLVAHSDWAGFTVYGQVETPALIDAVAEGLHRLRDGEASLAIHQRCGTSNLGFALFFNHRIAGAAALMDC